MLRRGIYLALIATALANATGCCCNSDCWPCGRTWCGSQCGQIFWHEWFSIPPRCCEPCNCCGDYTGCKNNFVRSGGPPMGRPYNYPPDDMVTADYNGPPPVDRGQPAIEEVPPGRTSSAGPYPGRRTSYRGPVDSPRTSRKNTSPRRLSDYVR